MFVHHEPSEIKFVKNGYGLYRKVIMHNDFILVGPKNDPAGIKIKKNIKEALKLFIIQNIHLYQEEIKAEHI